MEEKKEKKKFLKNFFGEFKKFITRGNVLDMAIGIIVGGAFTAIVKALSDKILHPLIDWLLVSVLGANSLTDIFTVLVPKYDPTNGQLLLDQSIYINWGAFINAIISFLLTALVLFCILKVVNHLAEAKEKLIDGLDIPEKKIIAKYRREGMTKAEAKKRYEEELNEAKLKKEEEERLALEQAEKERLEKEAKETAHIVLLEEIRDLLKAQSK